MSEIRIRRPEEQEKIYRELTDKNEIGIFSSYKDVFMLSLMIGFIEQKRVSFNKSLERISYNVFNEDTDAPIMNLISFVEKNDFNFVYSADSDVQSEKFKVIEEYAAAGAEILYEKVMMNEINPLNGLIDYLLSFEEKEGNTYENPVDRISEFFM